jgi:ribosomal protein S21
MTPPLYSLLAALRRDSAEVLREARRRRHFIGPSERRRLKSARARRRVRPGAARNWILVIRPINTQEVID